MKKEITKKTKNKNKKTEEVSQNNIKSALIKKALGFDSTEVVEEYVTEDGEIKLSKKKVTKKSVPPDMTALKILMESEIKPVEEMTEEELEEEKFRLLSLLKQENEENKGD